MGDRELFIRKSWFALFAVLVMMTYQPYIDTWHRRTNWKRQSGNLSGTCKGLIRYAITVNDALQMHQLSDNTSRWGSAQHSIPHDCLILPL